ncbi:MAG: hypothetical protein U0V72_05975 [Cytophagales bacterium]
MKKQSILLLCFLLGISISCKKKEPVSWPIDALTPIAKGTLNMKDILADSLYDLGADSSLKLVYSNQLANLKIDTLIPLEGEEYKEVVKLSTLPITTREIESEVSIRSLLPSMNAFLRAYLKSIDSSSVVVPPYAGISTGDETVTVDDVFSSATIKEGTLYSEVTNNLNFAVANITYEIRNVDDQNLIGSITIDRIEAKSTSKDSIIVDGKRVTGKLLYRVTNFDIVGSNGVPVFVDLDDGLKVKIYAPDLTSSEMTAIFPSYYFVKDTFDTDIKNLGDKKLRKVGIKSGKVKIVYESTAPDTVKFEYKIWDALAGADTFKLFGKFKPAIGNVAVKDSIITEIKDFNLTLEHLNESGGTTYNNFKSTLLAGFDSTGKLTTISENDSIIMKVKLIDIIPSYALGYFGKDTFNIGPLSSDFNVFENLNNGKLEFESVNLNLTIKSGAGVDAKVKIDEISGLNTKTGSSKTLTLADPIIVIPAATETPFAYAQVSYSITSSNSNVLAFLENMPNKINYKATVFTNYDSNPEQPSSFDNFLTENSSFDVSINAEIPLKIKASNITLMDTTNMAAFNLNNIDKINKATISILSTNELPLDFNLTLYVLDASNKKVDSLTASPSITSAKVETPSGKLLEASKQKFDFVFDNQRLVQLLTSKKIYFKAILNTTGPDFAPININNSLLLNLVGRFNYQLTKN